MSAASSEARPIPAPSEWVIRFAQQVPETAEVLDVACGSGRHGRFFRARGNPVVLLDQDISRVADMAADARVELVASDLEAGRPWPLKERTFGCVIVTNYLHRPIMTDIIGAVAPGGLLLYETFAMGNEAFGRPSNPDFLLHREELLILCGPELRVIAFEDLTVAAPRPACIQRIAAVREKIANSSS
ncbi:class I SAM-dependent methyltransferase [Nisaea acidiphila]|uniref:Class I SAM-dependent methyltransferase n=1 Tax=Nisaea acidiphila TaxID=1862145 RepID=A0A9J7AVT0_9PROT|nr:class I SAM-dependent methyltransferase [Nisaea acidiphila]UUX51416.1 class I SAM-dependent methyltransferase [Nisaea acidiphila]